MIASDPNRTVIPGFLVTAVVECPQGAHPSPVQGYYKSDDAFFQQYHAETKTQADFQRLGAEMDARRGGSRRVCKAVRIGASGRPGREKSRVCGADGLWVLKSFDGQVRVDDGVQYLSGKVGFPLEYCSLPFNAASYFVYS